MMEAILRQYMKNEPYSSEHFSNPESRRCLGPAAITAYSHLLRTRCLEFDSLYLSVENFLDVVKSEVRTYINGGSLVRADQCLTIALSVVAQADLLQELLSTEISDIFLLRSSVRADQNKTIEAVSDSAHAIFVNQGNIEAHFHLSKCLADIEKRAHSVQVLFFALSNHAIDVNKHFFKLTNAIAIAVAKLTEDELDLRPLPSTLFWLHDAGTWQTIVEQLAQKEEYNALGVVTIGTCANMRTCQSPNIVVFKAAAIPGVNYKFLNIGKMLKSICAQGIHQWHLQMAEFMIKREADVGTISEAFHQPLLVIMATLSMSGGMPSFLNLGFPKVPVTDLDEQDKDGNTAFHALLKGFEKKKSKTVEILCRELLSEGAVTSLRDSHGKMAEEYIPKTERLHKILSKAVTVSWPELQQRVEKIRKLAKDKMDASEFDRAIEIYEKGLSICQNFEDYEMMEEKLKFLTNLSIANDKKGNFYQSLKHAQESIHISHNYWKGHYWVGVSYAKLEDPVKASDHFLCSLGLTDSEVMRINIIVKVLELFTKIIDTPAADVWLNLMVNSKDEVWSKLLEKMTTNKLWKALQILLLGPPFSEEGQGHCWGKAASNAQLQTIFEVLDDSSIHFDRLILALLQHGADIKTITSCPEDVLHEVVRFCALTNDTSVLKYVLGKRKDSGLDFRQNAEGQTPLHKLCYMSGKRVTMDIKLKLARILCDAGLDPKCKDGAGKTALDYAPGNSTLKQFLEGLNVTGQKDNVKGNLQENTKWKDLKEQGNQMYKAGKYHEAAELYGDALKKAQKDSEVTNHEKAVLHGNLSECFLKQQLGYEALEEAERCVAFDAQWYKGHLRVAKALTMIGMVDQATDALFNSYHRIQEKGYSTKVSVLSALMDSLSDGNKEKTDIALYLCLLQEPDTVLELAVSCLKQNKWEHAEICHAVLLKCQMNSTGQHSMDLGAFCNATKLVLQGNSGWIVSLLFIALKSNDPDQVKSLKFHEGDTYFHAIVNIYLLSNSVPEVLFEIFLRDIVRDKNIRDARGNTVLHFLAQNKGGSQLLRKKLTIKVIECGVDVKAVNNDKKQAVDLCGKMDDLKLVFQHFIQTETVIEKRRNVGGASLSSREQSQTASKPTLSVPKESKTAQNAQPSKEAPKAKTPGQSLPEKTAYVSSQTRAHKNPEKILKPRKPCDECEELMREAAQCKKEEKESKLFLNLASVVKKKHTDPRHSYLKKTCLERLVANLVIRNDDDIPKSLLEIDAPSCRELINLLTQRGRWLQIYHLVRAFREKKGWGALKNFARQVCLLEFLTATSLTGKEDDRLKIFEFLMDSGGVLEQATSAELVKCAMTNMEFVVVLKLLERGADPFGVSFTMGDSPLHAALQVALEKDVGNFALFEKLTSTDHSGNKIYERLDLKCRDNNGDNLLHLAAKAESSRHAVRIVEHLYKNRVPVNQKNKDGRLPIDCLPNAFDPRAAVLQEGSAHSSAGSSAYNQSSSGARPKTSSWMSGGKDIQGLRNKMKETLTSLQNYDFDLYAPLQEEVTDETDEDNSSGEEEEKDNSTDDEDISEVCHSLSDDGNQDLDSDVETIVDANAFDNLPWEVECTEEVWNILKARKEKQTSQEKENVSKRKERITDNMKRIIVGKIQDLASGQWRDSLTKSIKHLPSSLRLHYIKLPQGGFILWELAVAYSPRCSKLFDENDSSADQDSGLRSGRIYSEIIRVWSISPSHSNLKSSIQKIRKSHQNGKNCVVKKNLKCLSRGHSPQTSTSARIPKRYEETDISFRVSEEEISGDSTSLCPPASTGKTEYHILKFYSFSSNLVATILRNIAAKVEFPFKVTDKEHELINLQSKTPLLLIGRSGTGKTTVCLYRLWGKFLGYWEKVGNSDHRILPRVLPATSDQDGNDDDEIKDGDDLKHEDEKSKEMKSNVASSCEENRDNLKQSFMNKESDPSPDESDATDEDTEEDSEDGGTTTRKSVQVEYHHLHQVFVTKNPKLCSEVKKSFNRLCQATDFIICQARDKDVPANTLDDIPDSAFPLFLTSRQLLILLDATVDGVPFFERDENLALKTVIPGWGTQKDIFHDIPLEVDSSDDESGGIAVASNHPSYHRSMSGPGRKVTGARPKHKPRPNRRECTYDVFAREVWPSIKKKGCHPSLVWTEIMSFIKGSYEALHTEKGYLDEKQYIDIGRKRAPNFSGDRSEIYNIFRRYVSYRREHFLFDEADFVFNIYKRLSTMSYRQWVFHQIYVDEIQDFTQGELCLLINLSEDPNEMLLTGDTAQTIMRGISFRFEDLRSLFYYAQESSTQCQKNQAAVKLPKGYEQLKHNYRSHTGILSLASAVLNLLAEFFKDSFDVLEPDQGMFPGPLPVVIETCKPGDLAFLLNGNRRKTSHIEFGAHQAILVVNDEAKESVPRELSSGIILSIYESKGLEFDDILIYNFFKDSKAIEEWRVVTSYLNILETRSTGERLSNYGPVNLDIDILKGQGRPHPLSFDPNKHKVLNAELKQLYTAVTRARVNVWIFDEDLNKRAPMFEYFKALKLVRCMRYDDDGQAVDTDTFFPEESSPPREWRKKGDVFMAQKLYDQAVKCYRNAGASEKLHLAQAHQAAQEASHMREKENVKSHEVKWAYFQAGAKFVYCGVLHYAAVCFLNAKEILLAAMAFEKSGEFEAAGHRYKDVMESEKASKCFKKCGLFHQAVKALADGKEYERAIECLHEYESKIQDLTDKGKEIPSVLRDNRPHVSLSEINLLHNLMDEYAKKSDEKRLKMTIKRVSNAEEQVRCLCKYKFFPDAAAILKNQGNFEEAVKLLMKEGHTREAMDYAELSLNKPLCSSVHLAISCRAYLELQDLEKEEHDPPGKSETRKALFQKAFSHSTSAKANFKESGHNQGIAQTSLLFGMLKKNSELLIAAVREFHTYSPSNPVGTIEAFKQFLITKKSDYLDESEIKTAIQVIQVGKRIIETLWKPSSKNADMELAYLMSYELQLSHQRETVTWSANEVPLSLLTRQRINPDKFKHGKEKSKAASDICTRLEEDLISWTKLVKQSLNMCLSRTSPCPTFQQGIKCVDDSCNYLHSFGRTKQEIMSTLTILLQKVTLERVTGDLYEKHGEEAEEKWQSISQLLDFLPPRSQRFALVPGYIIREVIKEIRKNSSVKDQMCRYFKFLWGNSGRVGTGKSNNLVKERAKESDWLIQTCFYERLLDLRIDVEEEAKKVEDELLKRGRDWLKKVSKYAIFAVWNDLGELTCVESLGGRFINSFKLLTGNEKEVPDLFEAFFPFTKLLGAFGKRGNPALMPCLEHLLFWMEFYSTLSFCFIAKINTSRKGQHGHFLLPASYKTTIDIVNVCKEFNSTVEGDIMSHDFKQRHPVFMLFQRQGFLINLLCGDERYSKISLIDRVVDLINGNPQDQLSAERILVLALVLLLNMQLNYVDIQLQFKLRRSLINLTCPSKTPERLRSLIQSARNVTNALEVTDALSKFLSSCEDDLCLANWDREKTSTLLLRPAHLNKAARMRLMENFPEIPQQDRPNEHQETTDTANDGEVERPDQEELERESQHRNQMRSQEERQKKAVQIIIKWLRLNLINVRLKKKSYIDFERQLQFESFVLTDAFCGVCGCSLQDMSSASELNDDHDLRDNVTPFVSHEKSQEHIKKMTDFTIFKKQYISQIHDHFGNIERFLLRHEVLNNPDIYANISITSLLEKFQTFEDMKNNVFSRKSWNFSPVADCFSKLNSAFDDHKSAIESCYEAYQEEMRQESAQAPPTVQGDRRDLNDFDPLGDFSFPQPKKGKPNKQPKNSRQHYRKTRGGKNI